MWERSICILYWEILIEDLLPPSNNKNEIEKYKLQWKQKIWEQTRNAWLENLTLGKEESNQIEVLDNVIALTKQAYWQKSHQQR